MAFKSPRPAAMNLDQAENLAIAALSFLAEDVTRLGRFLALTGIGPQDLKAAAGTHHIQAALLEYLMSDESLLLVFAAHQRIDPEAIEPAHRLLAAATARS